MRAPSPSPPSRRSAPKLDRFFLPLSMTTALLAAACTGTIWSGDDGDDPSVAGKGSSAQCKTDVDPGPTSVRRLTRFEYDNTVRDLLGDESGVAAGFAPEEKAYGFNNNAEALNVSPLLAEQYMDAAETIAGAAIKRLPSVLPCDPLTVGEDACARSFLKKFLPRAYRRPVTTEELARAISIYQGTRTDGDFAAGIRQVIEVVLQSPQFLYRMESADAPTPKPVALTSSEMANRLSYFLWGTMPDVALFDAAASDALQTKEQIAAQAARMVSDPRAHRAVANFHAQWLQLDELDTIGKSAETFPEFTATVRKSMKQETALFLESAFWGDGSVETLLSSPYTFVDAPLARFYGVAAPTGSGFFKVHFPGGERAGLLTQGSILAVHAKSNQTSPVARGKFVRERILCHELAPPPMGLMVTAPEPDPGKTTRERFAEHVKNPTCAGCHRLTDPIGFGFEHYDAVGRYRTTEGALAIDSSGKLTDTLDVDGDFDGAVELGKRLARSEQVRSCVVTQWFRYAHGRHETDADTCTMTSLKESFGKSGYDMRSLLVALTQTDAFRFRRGSATSGTSTTSEGGSP